ncbi:MAG: hypothetical protein R3296_00530 [Oleiphilaceae bacterium]|nr:hypothetical protein [Oleiphilaceae bacterium]
MKKNLLAIVYLTLPGLATAQPPLTMDIIERLHSPVITETQMKIVMEMHDDEEIHDDEENHDEESDRDETEDELTCYSEEQDDASAPLQQQWLEESGVHDDLQKAVQDSGFSDIPEWSQLSERFSEAVMFSIQEDLGVAIPDCANQADIRFVRENHAAIQTVMREAMASKGYFLDQE